MSPHLAEKFPAFVETCMSIAVLTRPHTLPIPVLRLRNFVHTLFNIHSSIFPLTPRYSSILIRILLFLHSRELHFKQSWNLVCLPILSLYNSRLFTPHFSESGSVTVNKKQQISYLASSSIRLLRFMVCMIYVLPVHMFFFPISPAVMF